MSTTTFETVYVEACKELQVPVFHVIPISSAPSNGVGGNVTPAPTATTTTNALPTDGNSTYGLDLDGQSPKEILIGPKMYLTEVTVPPTPIPNVGPTNQPNQQQQLQQQQQQQQQAQQTSKKLMVKDLTLTKKYTESFFHSNIGAVNVNHIRLLNCGLEDSGLETLFASTWIKNISKLILDNNPNLTIKSWKPLFDGTLMSMTHLSLCGNQLGNDFLKYVSPLLSTNKTLKRLDLWHNKISDEGLDSLCEAIPSNNHLEILILSNNRITDVGASELALCFTKRRSEIKEVPEGDEAGKEREVNSATSGSSKTDDKKDEKGKRNPKKASQGALASEAPLQPTPVPTIITNATTAAGKGNAKQTKPGANNNTATANTQSQIEKEDADHGPNKDPKAANIANAKTSGAAVAPGTAKYTAKGVPTAARKSKASEESVTGLKDGSQDYFSNGDPDNTSRNISDEQNFKTVMINNTLRCLSLTNNQLTSGSVDAFLNAIKSFDNEKNSKFPLYYLNLENKLIDTTACPQYQELLSSIQAGRPATIQSLD